MQALFAIWISMLAGLGLLAIGINSREAPIEPLPIQQTPSSTPQAAQKVTQKKSLQEKKITYPVQKVVDGDTVVIRRDGKNETLRLIGMDAPETTTLRKGVVECFGSDATKRARELLDGVEVTLEEDASQGTYDKYGRTLAYLILPDGHNFAEVMIAEGYAHEYTYNLPYRYQKEFKAAQKSAERTKSGLWNPDACSETKAQTAAPAHSADAATPTGIFECRKNTYNCSSFKTQTEAQAAFDSCGGSANDIHKLDSDGDGNVCEGLD